MQLSVIIVSFNTKDLTLKCLDSLNAQQKSDSVEIIVVDNASSDGSSEAIKQHFPQVKIIQNNENAGFGAANNQGAKQARGEYLLFLNSDTQVIDSAHLKLFEHSKKHQAEFASCQLLNPDGSLQPQGGHLPTLANLFAQMLFLDDLPVLRVIFPSYQKRDEAFFQKDQSMGWIGGTAMLIKADLFNSLGGFDERIFMYAEDVDLCWRAQKIGIKPQYFSAPQIIHYAQGSGSSKKAVIGEMRGLAYLFKKHQPIWKLAPLRIILKLGCALRIILFGIILQDEPKKSAYQEAFAVV